MHKLTSKYGKKITLHLIDGEASGRISCELSNWTGMAYKIPRVRLKDCGDISELNKPGVYLLLGKNIDGNDIVYIGEAEFILKRLNQHIQKDEKDFWHEVIIFISKDDNLNKAHIKFLENRLYEIAKSRGRYVVENSSTPTQSSISKPDRSEMEEFIENIGLLVSTLGHKLFDDKRETQKYSKDDHFDEKREPQKLAGDEQNVFYIKTKIGADAKGKPTAEGFVVYKGSCATTSIAPSSNQSYFKLKEKLLSNKVIVVNGENHVFSDDYVFASPSAAASIVQGRNANGLIEWKNSYGATLRDIESKQTN